MDDSSTHCDASAAGPDRPLPGQADLPPPQTVRWVASRKAAIVAAVRGGFLTLEEARGRYGVSTDEFMAWQSAFDRGGQCGLQIRRVQNNRHGALRSGTLRRTQIRP
jgi:hypothetical protein